MRKSFPRTELERALGSPVATYTRVVTGGYAANSAHWRIELADGRRTFAKQALDDMAAGFLRDEYRVYRAVQARFLAQLVGWYDEGDQTLLILEDLGAAAWPPPWTSKRIGAVLGALDELHAVETPVDLPPLEDLRKRLNGWELVDVVAWLPSLALEGGPQPWEVVDDSHGLAALLAGYFASRAGLPPTATAPRVRGFQKAQAEVALPWAARELGLPPTLQA